MFNGGFEQLPLGAGFDWITQPSSYFSVDFADSSAFEGIHCLRIDFPIGQNDEFEPVFQILPVAANQAYTLAAYVRSSDITSNSGPRLRVTDPDCPSCLDACTDATVGTTPAHGRTEVLCWPTNSGGAGFRLAPTQPNFPHGHFRELLA